jgi:hypothetical protein
MTRRSRTRRLALAALAVCVLVLGWTGIRMYRAQQSQTDLLPTVRDPDAGPRAPSTTAFGFDVGHDASSTVADGLAARGLACKDTSVRAMMQQVREHKRRELEEVERRGGDVDAVTGASIVGRKSPRERNPQLRLSCEGVTADALGLARPVVAAGRALFVFDSAEHPLRHASFRRSHREADDAVVDLRASIADWRARLGEPTSQSGSLPDLSVRIERLPPLVVEWRYADLVVRISTIDFGARGVSQNISVEERVEVPWGIRSDAPSTAPAT